MIYRFGDLVLDSELPCSQLPETAGVTPECSFRLAAGSKKAGHEGWDHAWLTPDGDVALGCARRGGRYRLEMPGRATFTIERNGRLVTGLPVGLPSPETIEHLLIDQVLPRVLAHRGRLVLHAGAVGVPSGAVAFLGDSGAGKSTLCGAFARRGDLLLGDDGIIVRESTAGTFDTLPTYSGLRLLPRSVAHLYDDASRGRPMAAYSEKRRFGTVRPEPEAVPLRAIYVLAEGDRVSITPLAGAEAVLALVRSTFHLHLDDSSRARRLFERIAAVALAIPIRSLAYPRDFALLDAVREAVLADACASAAA